MNKEELLAAARKEKTELGEFERGVVRRGITLAAAAGATLMSVMIIAELIITKTIDFGKPSIIFLMCGVADFFEGIKTGVKNKIVWGIIDIVVAIVLCIVYVGVMIR